MHAGREFFNSYIYFTTENKVEILKQWKHWNFTFFTVSLQNFQTIKTTVLYVLKKWKAVNNVKFVSATNRYIQRTDTISQHKTNFVNNRYDREKRLPINLPFVWSRYRSSPPSAIRTAGIHWKTRLFSEAHLLHHCQLVLFQPPFSCLSFPRLTLLL